MATTSFIWISNHEMKITSFYKWLSLRMNWDVDFEIVNQVWLSTRCN